MADRLNRADFLADAAQAAFVGDSTTRSLMHPAGFVFDYSPSAMFARWQSITGTATATRADCAAFALWLAQRVSAAAADVLDRTPKW